MIFHRPASVAVTGAAMARRGRHTSVPRGWSVAAADDDDSAVAVFDHRASSSSSMLNGARQKEYFSHMRRTHSLGPIPYDSQLFSLPLNVDNDAAEQRQQQFQHKKVTIVGCGQVGMAIAYALLNQSSITSPFAGTIALIDAQGDRLRGEVQDLEQGSAFHGHVRIQADTDYAVSHGSHLVRPIRILSSSSCSPYN
jgi:lactate/malate dehydrogenase, NAD binding domain